MSIKTNLQILRAKYGKTQTDMAKLLGVSYPTYCKKELEYREFSVSEAKKIADYFKMTVDDIFFKEIVHANGTN